MPRRDIGPWRLATDGSHLLHLAGHPANPRGRGLVRDLARVLYRLPADAKDLFAVLELVDQLDRALGRDLVEVLVVDLDDRRAIACRQAFGSFERELAIGGSAACR